MNKLIFIILFIAVNIGVSMDLTEKEKEFLLSEARKSITEASVGKKYKPTTKDLSKNLEENCGAFVSLHKNEDLRGCIGYILPVMPLIEAVREMAFSAAIKDSRFMPVSSEELKDISIEISVLTPPKVIATREEFIVGKHGIIIEHDRKSAVFLPQVAPEQGWDREETLSHLCIKAGLDKNDYMHPNMVFKIFEAIVFSEQIEKLPN